VAFFYLHLRRAAGVKRTWLCRTQALLSSRSAQLRGFDQTGPSMGFTHQIHLLSFGQTGRWLRSPRPDKAQRSRHV
jgi:hypothetical protein